MKVRYDFVSNSSSSSFIVRGDCGDVKLLVQKFAEIFHDCAIPWDLNDKVEISIATKNKHYKKLFRALKPDDKCDFSDYYEDYRTHSQVKKDPEEVGWERIRINFEELKTANDIGGLVDLIEDIRFESQDENSSEDNRMLARIFRFLNAIDCNPDASVSERNFLDENDHEKFYERMSEITEKFKKEN